MPAIEDHDYLKICANLASSLSISIAAARRRVEVKAAQEGVRDISGRKRIANKLLEESKEGSNALKGSQFDELLVALSEEENFMIED